MVAVSARSEDEISGEIGFFLQQEAKAFAQRFNAGHGTILFCDVDKKVKYEK
jgi:hypothetical protein